MKDIVIHGATFNSNFGDVLFAHLFYDKYRQDGFNVDLLQVDKGRKLCEFVRNELNYHTILPYEYALKKDALVLFSGGMVGQPQSEKGNKNLSLIRYNTFIKPLLDFQERGKKTFVIGVGGSQVYDEWLLRQMIKALNNADYVSFRNNETASYFVEHGLTRHPIVTSDTAMVVQNVEPKKLTDKKSIFVHIHQNRFSDKMFCQNVVPALKTFLKNNPQYDIVVSTCQVSDPIETFDSVKELGKNVIYHNYDNVWELCRIISGCDLVITPQLHCGIIGASLGKSVLSFAVFYEKIRRYYKSIDESERCIPLSEANYENVLFLLNKYHDKPIILSEDIRTQAKSNLLKLNNFRH